MINQHETKRPVTVCQCGAHAFVFLTKGRVALISPQDAKFVGRWSWSALVTSAGSVSAVRRENGTGNFYYMHREIVQPKEGFVVDHKNRDTLDNRRENLRPCTPAQNSWNSRSKRKVKSTPYKGVNLDKATGRYQAMVKKDGKKHHLGRFKTSLEAALAYDAASLELFGEFALTNKSLGLLP